MDAAGGGGYGDPLDRDPILVAEDVLDGYVSLDQAREAYGVVLDPEEMKVNMEQTERLRASRRGGTVGNPSKRREDCEK